MKRTYVTPKLNRYGNVAKITQRRTGRLRDFRGRRGAPPRGGSGGRTGS